MSDLGADPIFKKKEVVMTWGKYKGKRLLEIIEFDVKYCQWLHRQEFVRKFADIWGVLKDHFGSEEDQD